MIRMALQLDLNYQVDTYGADFLFNVHAAHTSNQHVISEQLDLNQSVQPQIWTDTATNNRYMRLHAEPGELALTYCATVDLHHHFDNPDTINEVPVRSLPFDVLGYLYPSRYCQSDRLLRLAAREFGSMPMGYARVQAICNWVNRHVAFTSNTSNSMTSAVDTLVERVGVCRDFAHLMIALCRAINIPARFVTGTDYGCPAGYGPPDFHAYVEVYLANRWYIFDPTGLTIPMGLMRFGTGRDAADVAFAMIFGGVVSRAPVIYASALSDPDNNAVMPYLSRDALATDGGTQARPGQSMPVN